jgi:Plasmid encoded RepA protein
MTSALPNIQPSDPADVSIMETDGPAPQFLHSVLCQVGLPRSATAETVFTRSNGRVSVTLQAGVFFNGLRAIPQPLPFGCKPRLTLIHACSEAVRTRRRQIEIGHSVRGFLRQLEIDCGGKEMAAFRRQMLALASTHMTLGVPSEDGPKTIKAPPVETFNAWLVDEEGQSVAWPGVLELGERFFETLLQHAVPLDPQSISALKSSALGLDLYAWLGHRLCRVRTDSGVMLSWDNLQAQFGTEYRDPKDFRKRFLGALRKVLATYKAAKVDQVRGGLRLLPSPPPIARKAVVVQLPAPAVNTAKEQRPAVPELPLRHRITEDGLDRLRDACPGWDRQWLLLRYLEFMADKPAPKNADASLVAWGRKFTKGKAP